MNLREVMATVEESEVISLRNVDGTIVVTRLYKVPVWNESWAPCDYLKLEHCTDERLALTIHDLKREPQSELGASDRRATTERAETAGEVGSGGD